MLTSASRRIRLKMSARIILTVVDCLVWLDKVEMSVQLRGAGLYFWTLVVGGEVEIIWQTERATSPVFIRGQAMTRTRTNTLPPTHIVHRTGAVER